MVRAPSLFSPSFQRDSRGDLVYFPLAGFRRKPHGYVMEARHRARRLAVQWARPAWIAGLVACPPATSYPFSLVAMIAWTAFYALALDALACGMVKTDLAYDRERATLDTLRLVHPLWLWSDVAVAALILAASVWLFFDAGAKAALPLFALASAFALWVVWRTVKLRRELAR